MNAFAAYRTVNAKICTRKKMLLSDKEWEKAVEFKTVPQLIDFLKKKPGYQDVFNAYKMEDLHRVDLEIVLERYVGKEIEKILHYFSGSYKDFFKTLLMEYEISDLLLLMRGISRNEQIEDISHYYVHSEKYGLSCYNVLESCKNLTQFVEALKGTMYYEVLKTLTEEDAIKREFHMEMKLYVLYYKLLMERAEKLSPKDKKVVQIIIGNKIDLINVQWIYRAIKYFDISPEEILIYSLPAGNKITYQKLKKLGYSKNVQEFKLLAEKYLSYSVFEEENDVFLDKMMAKHIYRYTLQTDANDESLAKCLAYISILNIEKEDLIALTEGIRYTLPESELKKYLVHTI